MSKRRNSFKKLKKILTKAGEGSTYPLKTHEKKRVLEWVNGTLSQESDD